MLLCNSLHEPAETQGASHCVMHPAPAAPRPWARSAWTDYAADLSVAASIPDRYVPSPEQRMDLYRRIAAIRSEADADDVLDELIDRFGEPPSAVTSLVRVALVRGEAGKAGITDITQKGNILRFTLAEFDMERVSAMYAQSRYKGRLKVEASKKPVLALRLPTGARVLDEAADFIKNWESTAKVLNKEGEN